MLLWKIITITYEIVSVKIPPTNGPTANAKEKIEFNNPKYVPLINFFFLKKKKKKKKKEKNL